MVGHCGKPWRNRPLPARVTQLSALCRQNRSATKAPRGSVEKSQKRRSFTEWRNRLKDSSLRGLSRWLRGKDQDQANVAVYDIQGVALGAQEATDMLTRHWRQVWAERRQPGRPTPETVTTNLVHDFEVPAPAHWTPWSEQDLSTALAKASGSVGADAWSAAEIR